MTPNLEEGIHMANQRTETKHWYLFSVNLKFTFFCLFLFSSKLKIGQLKKEERPEPQVGHRKQTPPLPTPLPPLAGVGSRGQALVWKWLQSLVMEESLSCPFCLCSSVGCVLGWICLKDWIVTKLGCYFSQPAERRCC